MPYVLLAQNDSQPNRLREEMVQYTVKKLNLTTNMVATFNRIYILATESTVNLCKTATQK